MFRRSCITNTIVRKLGAKKSVAVVTLLVFVVFLFCLQSTKEFETILTAENLKTGKQRYEVYKERPYAVTGGEATGDTSYDDTDIDWLIPVPLRDAKDDLIELKAAELEWWKLMVNQAQVKLWRNATIPYKVSRWFNTAQREQLATAINFFEFQTCIKWVDKKDADVDYVYFNRSSRGKCSSKIGRVGGRQAINLAPICFDKVGDVLHEMMHAIGFAHEHSRPDRGQWVTVNWENIIEKWRIQFRLVDTGHPHNTKYDFASLMHYAISAAAITNSKMTLIPVVGGVEDVMGQRVKFSERDVEDIKNLYQCEDSAISTATPEGKSTTPQSTTTTPQTTTTDTTTGVIHRCILLIGASGADPLIEYYHPTMDDCDRSVTGRMSTIGLNNTQFTSGAYLSGSDQIILREGRLPDKPPMFYGLRDSSAKQLPLPYKNSSGAPSYIFYSTTASISPTKALSCGGWDGSNVVRECYQFDSSAPTQWTAIAPLPRPLNLAASTSLGNENSYYVSGGQDQAKRSNQLYRYSITDRRWYEETPMKQIRLFHAAAALSATEFIVCGGYYVRSDCEVYNAITKKWRAVGDLNVGRQRFAIVNFNGRIYALGGEDKGGAWLRSVEEYDASKGWTLVKELKQRRHAFVAVAVSVAVE